MPNHPDQKAARGKENESKDSSASQTAQGVARKDPGRDSTIIGTDVTQSTSVLGRAEEIIEEGVNYASEEAKALGQSAESFMNKVGGFWGTSSSSDTKNTNKEGGKDSKDSNAKLFD